MGSACGIFWANSSNTSSKSSIVLAFKSRNAHLAFAFVGYSRNRGLTFFKTRACSLNTEIRLAIRVFPASHTIASINTKCSSMAIALASAVSFVAILRIAIIVRSANNAIASSLCYISCVFTRFLCTLSLFACQGNTLRVHITGYT